MEDVILRLTGVTVRIRDRKLLHGTSWKIRRGEQWAVLGPNGSGKSSLVRTIAGDLPSAAGSIQIAPGNRISLVSFELQQKILAAEIDLDHARHFSGNLDEMLTPRALLGAGTGKRPSSRAAARAIEILGIGSLLDRPFRHLSAGEMRKVLLARALGADPSIIILDEPFDGLDIESRATLARHIESLMDSGSHLVLVTHRRDELLPSISHVLTLRDGRIEAMGPREQVLAGSNSAHAPDRPRSVGARTRAPVTLPDTRRSGHSDRWEPVIEFRGVNVEYDGRTVIAGLDWSVNRGERWAITGPNGAGKTTLLNLVYGDNLQGYANDITLFGRRKGSGESVWELRTRMGIVTPHLQLRYRRPATGLEVVLSGFSDSVGLYRAPTAAELRSARASMAELGLDSLEERQFAQMSYGQRRAILIARALVKVPELLIMDEPCQGLDPDNRNRILDLIDLACSGADTTLLYVTHHADELPACLTHRIRLAGSGRPAVVEAVGASVSERT